MQNSLLYYFIKHFKNSGFDKMLDRLQTLSLWTGQKKMHNKISKTLKGLKAKDYEEGWACFPLCNSGYKPSSSVQEGPEGRLAD